MYKFNSNTKTLEKMRSTTFSSNGFQERFDIQEWIYNQPDILGEDLLIIGKEILPGDVLGRKTQIRLDLLALDRDGNLVVVELKRDDSGADVYWQAIKYAAHCSTFSFDQIVDLFEKSEKITRKEAEDRICEFVNLEDLENSINLKQRIILVAREFHSDALSSIFWLRDRSIDIRCLRLRPYIDDSNEFYIIFDIIIPLPEAEDYIEMKEARQAKKEISAELESSFSVDVPNFSNEELREKLLATFLRDSNLTPRLICFFEKLSSDGRVNDRDEIRRYLFDNGIGSDIGHSGRLLSNVSQFITKKNNGHLRQLLNFSSDKMPGKTKENYQLKRDYIDLVNQVIREAKNGFGSVG